MNMRIPTPEETEQNKNLHPERYSENPYPDGMIPEEDHYNIARPTQDAIREMSEYEEKTKRGLLDAFINIETGECAGIFWRNDGYSWYENTPKNTYQVSIPARTELDETGEDWEEELKDNIDIAIDKLREKIEMQHEGK